MKMIEYLATLIIMLVSCEYQLEETNFREIEPPSEYAYMEINLNDTHPLDTIYIWAPTKFTVNLNAGQLKIYQTDIKIDDLSIPTSDFSQSSVSFWVYPNQISFGNQIGFGKHQLMMNCITSSGTKSLADLIGYEGYQFEAYWNINVINLSEVINDYRELMKDNFTGGYHILEDGLLELYWDNPLLSSELITSCFFHSRYYSYEDLNISKKSVIVDDYACGESIYTITVNYKLVIGVHGYSHTESSSHQIEIVVDTPIPRIYVEDFGKNELRFYWDKPSVFANVEYAFSLNLPEYSYSYLTDTTLVVPKPVLGNVKCVVQFLPKYRPWPIESADTSFFYGKKVGFDPSRFLYNATENVVYSVNVDTIAVIDTYSLDIRNIKPIKSEIDAIDFISSPNSSKFAIIGDDRILIYDDSNLLFPSIIHTQRQFEATYALTNELLIESDYSTTNIYDLATGIKIHTQPTIGIRVKMSDDGQYFASYWQGGIQIYALNNMNFTKIGTFTSFDGYFGLFNDKYHFHPTNPDQIFIEQHSYNSAGTAIMLINTVHLIQLPQLEKLQSTNFDWDPRIINIDPVTELVGLYYSTGMAIAPLSDFNNLLFTTNHGGFYLFNGCLFSDDGYAIDIKKELFQP